MTAGTTGSGPPAAMPQDWPHRAWSSRVNCAPHRWHVQEAGAGPLLLLLHGAGGATHSWRGLMPLLAARYRTVALDLPGQGFTEAGRRDRFGLDAMAEDIAALARQQGWQPAAAIGHSAGGALALRLAEMLPLRAVVGLNAALGGFEGVAGLMFPALARMLALAPFLPTVFARASGTTARVRTLLATTGSTLDAEGVELYRRLVASPRHVDAVLGMMAQWRLDGLAARLPGIALPVLLLTGGRDGTVPPRVSDRAAAALPRAEVIRLAGLGHLMHEEAPDAIARLLLTFLDRELAADGPA